MIHILFCTVFRIFNVVNHVTSFPSIICIYSRPTVVFLIFFVFFNCCSFLFFFLFVCSQKIANLELKSVCSYVSRLAVKLIVVRLGSSHKHISPYSTKWYGFGGTSTLKNIARHRHWSIFINSCQYLLMYIYHEKKGHETTHSPNRYRHHKCYF